MKLRNILVSLLLVTLYSPLLTAQQISIILKDSTRGTLRIDSSNWNEAWIEVDGSAHYDSLKLSDVLVANDDRHGEILSVDSIGAKFRSHLALSVVLDNSGSMFHSYDSLTKYCDSLIDSLPQDAKYQAVTFDDAFRSPTHVATRRASVFIAQTRFMDSSSRVKSFWHYYDSIRTLYTPLYDAMVVALQNIEDRRMMLLDSLADVLLVVTDGQDNASRTSLETLREFLNALHVRMYAVNYRTEDGRLEWLTEHAGGRYYAAGNLKELRSILHGMQHVVRRQYYIRYRFPSLGPSGAPRIPPGAAPRTKGR